MIENMRRRIVNKARVLESLPHNGLIVVEIAAPTLQAATSAANAWCQRHRDRRAKIDAPGVPTKRQYGFYLTGHRRADD